jgi:hypothetical protein
MRTRTVLLYVSIVALLAGYLFYFEGVREKTRLSDEDRARLLFQVDPSTISAIRLSPEGGTPIALVRDGQWRLTEPIQSPADAFVLRGLLAAIAGLKRERPVEDAAQDLRPYGLDRPTLRFAFETAGRWHNLRIGVKTPVGDHFYASGDQENRVVLIAAFQESALNKSLADLRGKEPFTLRTDEIDRVEISRREGTLVLVRSEGKGWQAAKDPALKIKTAKVENLLNQLTSLRALRFAEGAEGARARRGLNPPWLRVTLVAKERRETLLVGAPVSNRDIYATSDQLPGVLVVDEDTLKKVPAGFGDLEDRTLLHFETDQVGELTLKLGDRVVQLERRGDTWARSKGEAGKAPEGWRVDALLRRVRDLEYVKVTPGRGEKPDEKAPVHLVLASRGGASIGALWANEIPAKEAGQGVLWLARGGEAPRAFDVAAEALRGLEQGVKQVLDSG